MKQNKTKKIIFEAVALTLVIILLATAYSESINASFVDNIKSKEQQKEYFIMAVGKCKKIQLNGEDTSIGYLKGSLKVYNSHVFGTIENYQIILIDKCENKIMYKQDLPKVFTLNNFKGLGLIKWIPFPHSPCSKFQFIGTATNMITEEM
jgi:hypothetical protein